MGRRRRSRRPVGRDWVLSRGISEGMFCVLPLGGSVGVTEAPTVVSRPWEAEMDADGLLFPGPEVMVNGCIPCGTMTPNIIS